MFAQYDADDPRSIIPGFLLNFDAYVLDEATGLPIDIDGVKVKSDDGRDRLYGDLWHDWLVGGTNCDWLFGGFGDDLLQLDDNLETAGGANTDPENDDPRFRDGDFAYGGAGRDVLIANTAQDRMFDWTGEFNSFVVPFSPFGIPTVNRVFSPHARDFIRALSEAGGSDEGPAHPGRRAVRRGGARRAERRPAVERPARRARATRSPATSAGVSATTSAARTCTARAAACPIIRVVKYVEGQDANVTGPVLTVGARR